MNGAREGTTNVTARPKALDDVDPSMFVEADVREDLRQGKEPFQRIMAARQQVPEGGVLVVRATFEPVPLYKVMGRQGFDHYTEELGDEDWRVSFYPAQHDAGAQPNAKAAAPAVAEPQTDPGVVVLDVREMEPPEPMVHTLAALENLPPGGTLLQINVRVPQFLLPLLDERGFSYEIREQEPELVRVFIRHKTKV